MQSHVDTIVGYEQLGMLARPYQPTFDFTGPFVSPGHEHLAKLPLRDGFLVQFPHGVSGEPLPGWLQLADALKLYEMAWFSAGDILEVGSYHGLSTAIMATALKEADRGRRIHTVDLDPTCSAATQANLDAGGLGKYVSVTTGEGAAEVRRLGAQQRQFGFAFVDHSHAYQPVREVCRELARVVVPRGFVLFHDYNDVRNGHGGDYGVYQAVHDGLSPEEFQFYGVFGCAALYRRTP